MDIYSEITALRERVKDLERIEQPARSGGLPVYPTLTLGSILFAGTGGVLAQDNTSLFWDDTNNRLTVTGLVFLGAGTSFPATPPTNGVYYRTDLGFLCYYDGTRWLTVQTFELRFPFTTNSATDSNFGTRQAMPGDYLPFIVRVDILVNTGVNNSGGNIWQFEVRQDGSAALATITSSAAGASASDFRLTVTSGFTQPISSPKYVNFAAIKSGVASNIDSWSVVRYRYVIT